MLRLLIEPTTFGILPMQDKQNPYIDIYHRFNKQKIAKEHWVLERVFGRAAIYKLPTTPIPLTDIVFVANGGLSLPRLREPLVMLPNMKWSQRQAELPFLKAMFASLGISTVEYPGREPFEGQAELKWFDGGRKAVCGYGFRSTRATFEELAAFFKKIYGPKETPELLVLPLASANYYHLDVAMLEYPDKHGSITKCVVHRRALSATSLRRLKTFLGPSNVTVIDTPDSFCLNAVVDGNRLITHTLTDSQLKPLFEKLTGLKVVQVPTTEFEKSGGSVRCMTLDIHGL